MPKRRGRFVFNFNTWPLRVPMQVKLERGRLPTLPEPIARLVYEQYAYQFGTEQSFERLHERGGFGHREVIALLADLIEREREERNG